MHYNEILQKLYRISCFGMKLGLENMRRLSARFGNPERQFETIHVAGSNGKGSVVTKIARAHEAVGLKVGLYTSPHISSFRERISINGEMISEQAVERLLPEIFCVAEELQIPATFFELTTLLAFRYFQKEKVDIAVLETGLGGRLDATNIVTPKLSIITSISLEHTDLLGDSIEAITAEKGGIIKPHVPILIGPRVSNKLIAPIAERLKSPLFQVMGTYSDFHAENKAVAEMALIHLKIPVTNLDALPPCRMETIATSAGPVILDVAHNPDGLTHLFQALAPKKYRIVLGLSKNKDIGACLSVIKSHACQLDLVSAPNTRGLDTQTLSNYCQELGIPATSYPTISQAVQTALDSGPFPILICGSFFILSDARKTLGIKEVCDPVDLTECLPNSTQLRNIEDHQDRYRART